ncbi:hypothetical protein PM082_003707 [Marasmius tenuissimus]|nr:hypothetical protein PM082_003707 [Marasmius tenuissimus]
MMTPHRDPEAILNEFMQRDVLILLIFVRGGDSEETNRVFLGPTWINNQKAIYPLLCSKLSPSSAASEERCQTLFCACKSHGSRQNFWPRERKVALTEWSVEQTFTLKVSHLHRLYYRRAVGDTRKKCLSPMISYSQHDSLPLAKPR